MARENDKIPTSRARRTATVATLAASEAVKQFGTRAANVARGEEASEEALARRQLETAKQIVAVLGTMKGAAMKFGQVMSFLDVGLVAEEHRDEFQRELAKLRDAAPTVSFKQMRRVIEDDLEEPIKDIFASFQEEPIAAASIGQVYKAELHDGREVAVKVQYPGVAGAVRADLQNLDMIMRLLKRMTPALDVKAITEEIRERIVEELDYELEAQNQRSLARIFAGHPFIVVPDVITELSRERVLVSEFVRGVGFEELKDRPQAERDRIGEIVFRFFLGCLYRHRQFSGDPHPGNFLLMEDGRVAFLDFGLFKRLGAEPVELELACQHVLGERAQEAHLRSRQAGRRAQLFGIVREDLLRGGRAAAEPLGQPQVDRARGLGRQLLADDRAHERPVGILRATGAGIAERVNSDLVDHRAHDRIDPPQVLDRVALAFPALAFPARLFPAPPARSRLFPAPPARARLFPAPPARARPAPPGRPGPWRHRAEAVSARVTDSPSRAPSARSIEQEMQVRVGVSRSV